MISARIYPAFSVFAPCKSRTLPQLRSNCACSQRQRSGETAYAASRTHNTLNLLIWLNRHHGQVLAALEPQDSQGGDGQHNGTRRDRPGDHLLHSQPAIVKVHCRLCTHVQYVQPKPIVSATRLQPRTRHERELHSCCLGIHTCHWVATPCGKIGLCLTQLKNTIKRVSSLRHKPHLQSHSAWMAHAE
jgi:hypothetical protein